MAWELPRDQCDRLRLAKGYPFNAPTSSYLFENGEVEDFSVTQKLKIDLSKRTAVIAHGSNRAPEQLARKFLVHDSGRDPIPVTAIWLHDHDVVYSAHVARYGSIAAELMYQPGTSVQVFLTWLTDEQLLRMHETELLGGSYSYGRLKAKWDSPEGLSLPDQPDGLTVYRSSIGALNYQGSPLALKALPAKLRSLNEQSQEQVLAYVHENHGVAGDLDEAILESIKSNDYRKSLISSLRKQSLDVSHPSYTIIS